MGSSDEALLAMYELELEDDWGGDLGNEVRAREGRIRRALGYGTCGLALSAAYGVGMHLLMHQLVPRPALP